MSVNFLPLAVTSPLGSKIMNPIANDLQGSSTWMSNTHLSLIISKTGL